MANLNKLDLKLVLSLANAYQKLNEKGEITDQQLEEIMQMVENFQSYNPKDFKSKLHEIFPDSEF